jgi:ribosomal protein S18 acetylase RimI-like enzyme
MDRPTPGNLTIRLATLFDRGAMEHLPFSAGSPDKVLRRLQLQEQGHMEYPIALIDDRIVGYLLLKWNCPEDPFLKRRLPPCAEIEDFVVDPELRRHGVGTAMLDYAAERSREHGDTRLGLAVGKENKGAARLYDRYGFVTMPDSDHRVSWFAPNADGTTRIDSEECVYLMKDLL